MKKDNKRSFVAPIVITIIFLIYYVLYFGFLIALIPGVWRYLLLIIPLCFAGVMIFNCVQRIKEIRSGEEDDLSQY